MELAGGGSGGPCVFECLRLSKAVRASGLELTLSVVSGGSVEVYNCATGSADCSQCLGREDLGHRCLWSESSSSCRLQTEPPQVPEVCPPPEIRKVRPEGSMEGVCGVTWGDVGVGGVGWQVVPRAGTGCTVPRGAEEDLHVVPGAGWGQDPHWIIH